MLKAAIILLNLITGMQEYREQVDVPQMTTNTKLMDIAAYGAHHPKVSGYKLLKMLDDAREPYLSVSYMAFKTNVTDPIGHVLGNEIMGRALRKKAMCRYGVASHREVMFIIVTCQDPGDLHRA